MTQQEALERILRAWKYNELDLDYRLRDKDAEEIVEAFRTIHDPVRLNDVEMAFYMATAYNTFYGLIETHAITVELFHRDWFKLTIRDNHLSVSRVFSRTFLRHSDAPLKDIFMLHFRWCF